MDDRTFYDIMSAYANPHHVASTVGGAMVQQGLSKPANPPSWSRPTIAERPRTYDPAPYDAPDFISSRPSGAESPQPSSGRRGSGGPGFMDGSANATAGLAMWFIRVLWPLNALERLGRRITRVRWKGRLPLAVMAAIAGPGVVGSGGTFVLLAGAVAGWFLLPVLGTLIALVAVLTGLALALGTVGICLVIAYNVLRALLT